MVVTDYSYSEQHLYIEINDTRLRAKTLYRINLNTGQLQKRESHSDARHVCPLGHWNFTNALDRTIIEEIFT